MFLTLGRLAKAIFLTALTTVLTLVLSAVGVYPAAKVLRRDLSKTSSRGVRAAAARAAGQLRSLRSLAPMLLAAIFGTTALMLFIRGVNSTAVVVVEPSGPYSAYQIQEGDTVNSIASLFGIEPLYLTWNNPELYTQILSPGKWLFVPRANGVLHQVRSGETLDSVSRRYGVPVERITAYTPNHLADGDALRPGMVLLIVDAKWTECRSGPNTGTSLVWPVQGPISAYCKDGHPGIDVDMFHSPGAAVVAAASGTVTFAGGESCCSYGLYVVINHGNGLETLYAHLEPIAVEAGDYVSQGEVIGYVGLTGYTTGYHLHFQVTDNGVLSDPLLYLQGPGVTPTPSSHGPSSFSLSTTR